MKKLFVLLLTVCSVCILQAQKVKGDLSVLKGQTKVNVEFVYDGVTYDGDSEAKFFKDNKGHDDFEQWKKDWTSTFRTDLWEVGFLKDLNKEIKGIRMEAGKNADATYTLKVKITDIDPGSFAGPFSQPSKLTGEVYVMKTGSSESAATISFSKIYGNANVMTPVIEHRVKFAFEELGETIGETLKKKVK